MAVPPLELQRYWRAGVAQAGRRSARERVERLRRRAPNIAQCALAGAAAWGFSHYVLGHAQPFFAPVAAVVTLGQSYQGRLRRTGEVVVGVALGVAVGDLLVGQLGSGVWQLALVVGLSMSLAVLLDAGQLLVTQAGVQASIVTALVAPTAAGVSRWVDAVVGGTVAIAVAALLPTAPLHRPRRLAASAVGEVAALVGEAAVSARDADPDRASAALERARAGQPVFDNLRSAAQEGLDNLRMSPFRHRHRPGLQAVAELAVPLDRAMRNVRVLLRRVTVAGRRGEPLPVELPGLLDELAEAAHQLAEAVAVGRQDEDLLDDLVDIGHRAGTLAERNLSLSAAVVVGQLRSTVVDLLEVGGRGADEALAAVPPTS